MTFGEESDEYLLKCVVCCGPSRALWICSECRSDDGIPGWPECLPIPYKDLGFDE